MTENEIVTGVKKMAIGCLIAEYGMLEIVDSIRYDLKHNVKAVIAASQRVQKTLMDSPKHTPEAKEALRKMFLKSEYYLISEILVALWDFSDDDLEYILNTIKSHTDEQPVQSGDNGHATGAGELPE